jgi:pyruvate kinase
MIRRVDQRLIERGAAKAGDRIAIVFGAPVGEMGHTNSVRLHQVGGLH